MPASLDVFGNGIVVDGLAEFRAAVRRSSSLAPRQLTAGLKKAGAPVLMQAKVNVPYLTGRLASSFSISVRGPRADIVSRAPYAGGAEWGRFGKWAAWARRYGAPPRFVYPAIERQEEAVAQILLRELEDIVSILGWARY